MQFAQTSNLEPGVLGDASPELKLTYSPVRDISYCYLAVLDSVLADIAAPDFPADYWQQLNFYDRRLSREQIQEKLLEFGRSYRQFVLTALDQLKDDEYELSDYQLFQRRLITTSIVSADKPVEYHEEVCRLIVLSLLGLKLGQLYYHVLPYAAAGRANTPQQLSGYLFSRAWLQAYMRRGQSVLYQLGVLWRAVRHAITGK